MGQSLVRAAQRPTLQPRRLLNWLAAIVCFAMLAYVLVGVAHQILVAPSALRLVLLRDVPLPSGLGATSAGASNPLAPGGSVQFDHFDFQAYDPQTHKLFIAHTGPKPLKLQQAHIAFDPATDGHIIVFDTLKQSVIARVDLPQVTGLVVAGDLGKVYASATDNNSIYAIDESSLAFKEIPLGDDDTPDALSYDSTDHRVFVSVPGSPTNPDTSANIDPSNQNIVVIDAHSDSILAKINIGHLPKLPGERAPTLAGSDTPVFGYDIGHNQYDSALHRVYVTTQILPDLDRPNGAILPPLGTGELMAIDPITAKVVQRTQLPASCLGPHGLALDTAQEVAFIACVEVDAAHAIAPNLARVDLRTGRVIAADPQVMRLASVPDIVAIDHAARVVLVGCRGGISVFDERPGAFHKLADYQMGKNTHTIALDEATQYLYLPLDSGGRPVLRVVRYNPSGA